MKLQAIQGQPDPFVEGCTKISALGLRGKDDLVTVIDQATLDFCRGEGKTGLCTAKFRADFVVDTLSTVDAGEKLSWGTCRFTATDRQKHCHGGCRLDPVVCLLNGRVLFLKITTPGRICIGDELTKS